MAAFNVSLPNVMAELNEKFPMNIQSADYNAYSTSVAEHRRRQTANFEFIEGAGRDKKKRTVRVYWKKMCTITPADCTDECAVSTNEITDDSEDYTISGCKMVNFKESWKRLRTAPHRLEENVAFALNAHLNALDTWLNGQFIAFVEANKGAHEYTQLPYGSDNSGDWEIPAIDWKDDLAIQFALAAQWARFPEFYMLSGLNLYSEITKARAYAANGEGKGENNLWGTLPVVFDPLKIEELAAGKTYMINPSSLALITDNWWDAVPIEHAGNHRMFTLPSRTIPGVSYDIHNTETCSSDDFVSSWQIRVNYEFVLNPEGCTANRTGILAFKKV